MALTSMTGFARAHGISGSYAWAWELKSVNGKGLDLRLRMPSGWDAIEAPVRARAAERLARGSIQAALTVDRSGVAPVVRINAGVLDAILTTLRQLAPRIDAGPPSLDGLLSLKGVMEVSDLEENEDERRAAETAAIAGFGEAVAALSEMRQSEGAALARILTSRLDEIAALAQRAEQFLGCRNLLLDFNTSLFKSGDLSSALSDNRFLLCSLRGKALQLGLGNAYTLADAGHLRIELLQQMP